MKKNLNVGLLGLATVLAIGCGGSSDSEKKESVAGDGGESAGATSVAGSEDAGEAGNLEEGGEDTSAGASNRGGQNNRGGAAPQGGRGGAGGAGPAGGRAGSGGGITQFGGSGPQSGGSGPNSGGTDPSAGGSGNAPSQGGDAGGPGDGGSTVGEGGSTEAGGEGDGGTGEPGGWMEAGAPFTAGTGVGGDIGPGGWVAAGGTPLPAGGGGPSRGGTPNAGGAIEVTVPLPEVEPPAGCTPSFREGGPEYCSTQLDCNGRYFWVDCSAAGPGRASCWCYQDELSNSYELTGVVAGESCDYVTALCMGSVEPPTLSAEECSMNGRETSTTYCSTNYTCTQSGEIVEGASLVVNSSQGYYCSQNDEEALSCSCSNNQASMGVGLPDDTPMTSACSTLQTVCTSSDDITYLSEPTCTFSSESAYQTNCSSYYNCARDAQLGEMSLQVSEALNITCNRNAETTTDWDCNCALGLNTIDVTVTPEDPWSTCSDSMDRCLGALTDAE